MTDEISSENLRFKLVQQLAEIQGRRPGYSVRQFATALKVDYSSFTRILSGKRKISAKMIRQLTARLIAVSEDLGVPLDVRPRELSKQEHLTLARWKSPAIQELCHTKNFQSTSDFISERLSLDVSEVDQILETLIRIGFLVRTPDGKLWDTVPAWYSDTFEGDPESKAANLDDLKDLNRRAELCYEKVREELSSFSNIIIATDPSLLPKVKSLISRFRKDLLALLRNRDPKEVFAIKIDLFPLTKVK